MPVPGIRHRTRPVVDIQQNGVIRIRVPGQVEENIFVLQADPTVFKRTVREDAKVLTVPVNHRRHQFAERDHSVRSNHVEALA